MTVIQIILKKGVEGQGIGVECVGAEEESRKLMASAVTSGRNWEAGSVSSWRNVQPVALFALVGVLAHLQVGVGVRVPA